MTVLTGRPTTPTGLFPCYRQPPSGRTSIRRGSPGSAAPRGKVSAFRWFLLPVVHLTLASQGRVCSQQSSRRPGVRTSPILRRFGGAVQVPQACRPRHLVAGPLAESWKHVLSATDAARRGRRSGRGSTVHDAAPAVTLFHRVLWIGAGRPARLPPNPVELAFSAVAAPEDSAALRLEGVFNVVFRAISERFGARYSAGRGEFSAA